MNNSVLFCGFFVDFFSICVQFVDFLRGVNDI
nr:MAG TPA: hypothetical protein [Caudoviricetes sp.]